MAKESSMLHGVGRRKSAVARVWIKKGLGKTFDINGRKYKDYFSTEIGRSKVTTPIQIAGVDKEVDIKVTVEGGGVTCQADAVRLGIARALLAGNENLRSLFRKHNLLTVDSRIKERKKYGQRGARAKFQFVKR
jgi:small subunit ribosomal protein S9